MKNIIKKLFVIVVILMILFSVNTKVFALSEIISDGQGFLQQADQSKANIDVGELQNLSGYVYNILLAAGVVISVIVATALGIQFMLGGTEGQVKVKEMLIPFIVGCVIVFGGFGLWKIAMSVGNKIESVYPATTSPSTPAPSNPSTTPSSPQSFERDENGNPICRACKDPLGVGEQRRGRCSNCGEPTHI